MGPPYSTQDYTCSPRPYYVCQRDALVPAPPIIRKIDSWAIVVQKELIHPLTGRPYFPNCSCDLLQTLLSYSVVRALDTIQCFASPTNSNRSDPPVRFFFLEFFTVDWISSHFPVFSPSLTTMLIPDKGEINRHS